jgi:hypothetical protein
MKRGIFLLVLVLMVRGAFSEKLAELAHIIKPETIAADGQFVYITDEEAIHQFSGEDMKYIRQIGRKGQGPGEFPGYPRIKLRPGTIVAASANKLLYFDTGGRLQRETRLSFKPFKGVVERIGANFVSQRFQAFDEKGNISIFVSLYDSNLSRQKELYRLSLPQPTKEMWLVAPRTRFCVYGEKIFIAEPAEGFVIEVFDSGGTRLYRIDKEYEKIRIPESLKQTKIAEAKRTAEKAGYWEVVKNKIHFPAHFPAIESFAVTDEKIYVQTNKTGNQQVEFVILDLKGKTLKRTFLPDADDLFTIHNNRYYYLKENPDDEMWELHLENI